MPPDTRISGFQDSNLRIIRDIERHVSGEAIFIRMLAIQATASQAVIEAPAESLAIREDVRLAPDQSPERI